MSGPALRRFATALVEPPPPRRQSHVQRYGAALVLVAAAVVLTALVPALVERGDLMLSVAAITLAAWYGGVGAGVLAAVLAIAAHTYVLPPQHLAVSVAEALRLGVFVLVAVLTGTAVLASRRTESTMREQWRICRVTLASIGDAVIVTDTAAHVTFMNDVAETLTGWSRAQAFGQPLTAVFHIVNEATRQVVDNPVARVVREGAVAGLANHTVLIGRDGRERPIDDSGAPIRDNDGAIAGVILVFRDVSERQRAEEEREQLLGREQHARAQAEAANRAKDEFLATISHELRTPLTAILGWVRLLRTTALEPAAVTRALDTIDRNATSQAQLIDDLLDVSRIITGRLHLDVRPVDLVAALDAALDSVRPAAEAKRIQLTSRFDPGAGPVLGDAARLQQVLWNLLSNAVKFTGRDGHVDVALERHESSAVVRVRDDGQGIAAEFLPHVFDRFTQAESGATRRIGGLGLGLAIVRHLFELHGGTVEAESAGEGQGATFRVRLPLRSVLPPGSEPESAARAMLDAPRLDGLRVLVVDDNADSLDLFRAVLESRGAAVATAASAAQALAALHQDRFDVLLSDINLPGEDGLGLIRKIRALPPEHGGLIAAVALTAYAASDDRARLLDAGFQAHLAKPAEPAVLLEIVAQLSGRTGTAPQA